MPLPRDAALWLLPAPPFTVVFGASALLPSVPTLVDLSVPREVMLTTGETGEEVNADDEFNEPDGIDESPVLVVVPESPF